MKTCIQCDQDFERLEVDERCPGCSEQYAQSYEPRYDITDSTDEDYVIALIEAQELK